MDTDTRAHVPLGKSVLQDLKLKQTLAFNGCSVHTQKHDRNSQDHCDWIYCWNLNRNSRSWHYIKGRCFNLMHHAAFPWAPLTWAPQSPGWGGGACGWEHTGTPLSACPVSHSFSTVADPRPTGGALATHGSAPLTEGPPLPPTRASAARGSHHPPEPDTGTAQCFRIILKDWRMFRDQTLTEINPLRWTLSIWILSCDC